MTVKELMAYLQDTGCRFALQDNKEGRWIKVSGSVEANAWATSVSSASFFTREEAENAIKLMELEGKVTVVDVVKMHRSGFSTGFHDDFSRKGP